MGKSPLIGNVSRPLMSSELPRSIIESPPIESIDIAKWSDEQLLSSGWTKQQIESYRSSQLETSTDKMEDVEEEWDTGW